MTNYSVDSLVGCLSDCDGVVSAIQDTSMNNVEVHLALLEACRRTTRCRRFIPSDYAGNLDDFPKQPLFYFDNHQPIRDALVQQDDVQWTLVNNGWLADYVVPSKYRYIKDIGEYHPVDFNVGTMIIPGTGDEPICCTAARDVARAIARLFRANKRPAFTYVSGEATTWNLVKDLLVHRGVKLEVSYQYVAASSSTCLPEVKVAAQRRQFFQDLTFRSLEQLLDEIGSADASGVCV